MIKDDLAKKLAKGHVGLRVKPEQAEKLIRIHEQTGIKSISGLYDFVLHAYDLSEAEKRGAA